MPAHEPKTRTVEQALAWEIFRTHVRIATDVDSLMILTDDFAKMDKSQASFAYNRAKKTLEDAGYYSDPKWFKKGFGPMGHKQRREFLEVFRHVSPTLLPQLKDALLNEDTHRLKNRKRPYVNLPVSIRETPAYIVPAVADTDSGALTDPKPKKVKKSNNKTAEMSTPVDRETEEVVPSAAALTAVAAVTPEVQAEAAKSIKAARLADAMQHPSFGLLTKVQQQSVRDDWLALLK